MLSPRTYRTPGAPRSAVTMGYVTWSSTMSALRPIHSVEMITWVSESSGIASSGVLRKALRPKPAATRMAATVSARFRAHLPMRRSIIAPSPLRPVRLEPALGRDQEVPRGHDGLAGGEARDDFVLVARLRPQGHGARSEPPVSQIHEYDALVADVENGALRNRESLPHRGAEQHVHEHVGLQVAPGVGRHDADLRRPRLWIQVGIDRGDGPRPGLLREKGRENGGRHSGPERRKLVGIDARDHPDGVDGRDLVERLARGEGAAPDDVLLQHDAAGGREDGKRLDRLPRPRDGVDLPGSDVPAEQPRPRRGGQLGVRRS